MIQQVCNVVTSEQFIILNRSDRMFWYCYSIWLYRAGKGSLRWNLNCLL